MIGKPYYSYGSLLPFYFKNKQSRTHLELMPHDVQYGVNGCFDIQHAADVLFYVGRDH